MAYGRKQEENPNKLTGLFRTKGKNSRKLWVGTVDEQYLGNLIRVVKEAKADGKGVTFFLWKSDYEDGPAYNLTADVAQDRQERGRGPRRNEEDEDRPRHRQRTIEEDDEPVARKSKPAKEDGDDPFKDD